MNDSEDFKNREAFKMGKSSDDLNNMLASLNAYPNAKTPNIVDLQQKSGQLDKSHAAAFLIIRNKGGGHFRKLYYELVLRLSKNPLGVML